jgi:hypothetical protein
MKKYLLTLALCSLVAPACLAGEEEDSHTATMCYVKSGTTVTVNCLYDSSGTCSSAGKTALGSYDTWDSCWADTSKVLSKYKADGTLAAGPNSNEAGGGSGGSGGGSSGGSFNWSFTCSDGVGGTKTLPIPKGACETQYKAYGKAFGCNEIGNFYSTCFTLYTCLVKNEGSSYQKNLDYCRSYK